MNIFKSSYLLAIRLGYVSYEYKGETKKMASAIKIVYNITQQTWNFLENDLAAVDGTTLEFSFVSKDEITQFTDLKFGMTLYHNDEVIVNEDYPKGDTVYECADSNRLIDVRVNLLIEENYTLKVWGSNAGIRSESQHKFTSPRTPQLFPSWLWQDKTCVPPIPAPEGQHVRWRESTQSWVPVLPEQPVWGID